LFPQPRVKYDVSKTQKILDLLHQSLALYGYQTIETSVIESADLFLTKAGDQIITRLFTFERHGHQLALRPEFTAAAAHRYAQSGENRVARWQFSGAVFEDDPNDFRHNYQRLSVGAELMGMSGAVADAEVLTVAADNAHLLSVPDWQLVVGHVGLTRQLLSQFMLDNRTTRFLLSHLPKLKDFGKDYVMQLLDKALLGRESSDSLTASDGATEVNTQQMLDVLLDATQRGMTMGGRTRHDIARRLLPKSLLLRPTIRMPKIFSRNGRIQSNFSKRRMCL
jgi:histidyl-tRNA synthetase